MSIEAIAWALKQRTGSATLKGVLVAVANYADERGRCWPSQERLAWLTEMGERTVRRSLLELEEKGFLKRQDRFESGKRLSDMITLNFQRPERPVEPAATVAGGQAARVAGLVRPDRPDSAATVAGKPSLNPSEENPLLRAKSRKKIPIDDFRIEADAEAIATGLGLTADHIDACENRFRAYNATATPQTWAQWLLHWQTWCENFARKHDLIPKANTSTEVIREGVMLDQTDPDYEAWEQFHGRKLPAGKSGKRWFPTRKPPPKQAAE